MDVLTMKRRLDLYYRYVMLCMQNGSEIYVIKVSEER